MATTRRRITTLAPPQSGQRTSTATGLARTPHVINPDVSSPQGLLSLVMNGAEISVDIPDTATLIQVEESAKVALEGYHRLSEAAERLKPIIGRFILAVAERKLYRPDYKNLTHWIEERVVNVPWGISRTNAFEALRIAKAFPSMSLSDYAKYGATRLLHASSITDEKDPKAKELLDSSTRETVDTFKKRIGDMKADSNPPSSFVVSIRFPLAYKATWDSLLTDLNLTPADLIQELISSYIEHHPVSAEPELLKT